jgi:hypothetical protein
VRPITQEAEKRDIFNKLLPRLKRMDQIDEWVAGSPLVHVDLKVDEA